MGAIREADLEYHTLGISDLFLLPFYSLQARNSRQPNVFGFLIKYKAGLSPQHPTMGPPPPLPKSALQHWQDDVLSELEKPVMHPEFVRASQAGRPLPPWSLTYPYGSRVSFLHSCIRAKPFPAPHASTFHGPRTQIPPNPHTKFPSMARFYHPIGLFHLFPAFSPN
jgi:hypothetical protein